ncbi:hypothetical protein JDV02_006010 [Purpureocillium takamizusanense]|uniref:NACHT domain-containing protein n=1 Tax=Purpureocillium takamizusanense TaxID=2060973 RepID=A0A9Q8VAW9_9HYPO|nr:uncharacterized protein JDV02_006010 [Purpureocillium takamizusanense]UNI19865.1 hypothetical protein JDV02_006010 [Purpureocillium takamizusanense]
MEAISTLRVAGSAIQVVEFGARTLSIFKELSRSEDGTIDEFRDKLFDAQHLRQLARSLVVALHKESSLRALTDLEQSILSLCTETNRVAEQLVKLLKELGLDGKKKTAVSAVRAALSTLWRRDDVEALEQQLVNKRDSLTNAILASILEDLHSGARHGVVSPLPWNETQTLQGWADQQNENLKTMERNLSQAVEQSTWRAIKGLEDRTWTGIQPWAEAPVVQTLQSTLLERLQYPERLAREARIPEAFNSTFDWIYSDPEDCEAAERPWSSFKQWLESGDSVYWITGKPGSGKSTLMKMLYHEPRTAELLKAWAGSCGGLVIAGFYFWHAGTELQTSHEGLFRSLLHQALSQRLAMSVTSVVSNKWSAFSLAAPGVRDSPLPWEQLVQGLRLLVEEEAESHVRYAFFIDGLDEYVGNSSRLISLIRNLSSYPNVKICVSSRPWNVFEDEFRQAPNLMLQHRTHDDIALYAEQNLTTNTAFQELQEYNPDYASNLIQNITEKASGVFLWVVLVVRSLIDGLEQGDRPSELQERLDGLPAELDDLFTKMLHGLEGRHFRDAAHLFRMVKASERKPSVLTMSFADSDDADWALNRPVAPIDSKEVWYRAVTMKRRLVSRCKGLLEVGPLSETPSSHDQESEQKTEEHASPGKACDELQPDLAGRPARAVMEIPLENGPMLAAAEIDYLHRTVEDFLSIPRIWTLIMEACDNSFDPHAALFKAHLAHLKNLTPTGLSAVTFVPAISRCIEPLLHLADHDVTLHVCYLSVLDRTAATLASNLDDKGSCLIQQYWASADHHWASILYKGKLTDDFLVFAVRCGLIEYVRAHFESSPPSKQLVRELHETAGSRSIPRFYSSRDNTERMHAMIKLLASVGGRLKEDDGSDSDRASSRASITGMLDGVAGSLAPHSKVLGLKSRTSTIMAVSVATPLGNLSWRRRSAMDQAPTRRSRFSSLKTKAKAYLTHEEDDRELLPERAS